MHTRGPIVIVAALAVLAVLASPVARADAGGVKVSSKPDVGRYLTDDQGRTLYVFKKDAPGKSACAGDCIARWPVFYQEKVAPAGGPKASDFGTLAREDGQKQTTYKGLPLYYFAGDQAASDTKGQGFKDVWVVASP